jgi:hypothetical protein
MQWWAWLVIALAVIALLVVSVLAVQARRRRGGVIVDRSRHANRPTGGSA